MKTGDLPRTGRTPLPTPAGGAGPPARAQAPAATVTPAAQDTYRRLAPDVASGKVSRQDAQLLAEQSTRRGVIGEAEALTAVRRAAALPPADRAQLQKLLAAAGSSTERAFLYKALAAGHGLPEIASFAKEIRGWDDAKLVHTLNLADPTGAEDGIQDGLAQQFEDSCVPTTAQALRGELDPIYSLQVRRQNTDVHFQPKPGTEHVNPGLGAEQKDLLERVGDGTAVPVGNDQGAGVDRAKIDDVLNAVSQQTGLTFKSVTVPPGQAPEPKEALLDRMADQLKQGIPTPFELRTPDGRAGHYALALAVEGSGPQQRFLVHDPYTGNTGYVTREAFVWGAQDSFPNWDLLRIAWFAQAGEPPPAPPRADRAP